MALAYLLDPVIRLALPPRCAGCGIVVGDDHRLCVSCWQILHFLSADGCPSCGIPMDHMEMTCGRCLEMPPVHDGVRSAVAYGGIASDVAIRLKHGGRTGLARLMAQAMARHLPEEGGILLPVPLHRWRLWWRGFNQSLEIARALSRLSGLPVAPSALIRVRKTPMLGGLGRKQRERALRGVFAVDGDQRDAIRGQNILLIDDVYTSGATANGCARVLKRAGAASVLVLTWARVLQEDEGFGN